MCWGVSLGERGRISNNLSAKSAERVLISQVRTLMLAKVNNNTLIK